ncbi:NADH-dependent alcohol dehydrogenase [Spirochaetia bacterium]|nr:NADH-dependent alcohol dehydrogenase [Spirochaetia bacterium]
MKNFTNFTFNLYTDIVFGKGTEAEAGRLVRKHGGGKVMLVYGGGSIKKSGLYDRVVRALKDEGLPFTEFGGVQPNPRRSLVDKGIRIARDEKVDFLLGVGGGSAIDTAKAIALALANGGEYWKFYNGTPAEKMAPVGTIHTIAAAGSETSRSSVLVDDLGTGRKQGFMWEPCRPRFAIMNPELTYTVSPYQTGAGSADIVAHTVSRFFTASASRLGDEYAEGTMRTVVHYAPIAIARPNDYEARAELMLAGSFSHNDLTGIGRNGPRGGEHGLESQLSGFYDTAHGAGLAAVMPAWLQYIVDHGTTEQAARVAQFGVKVFGAYPDLSDVKATANDGLNRFRAWVKSIGMPLTLKELNIPKGDLPAIIQRCLDANGGKVPGWVELDAEAVRAIFTSIAE